MEHVIEVGSEAGLYAAYRTDLVRFATALVGSADAADVVSDAVLSLLKSGQLREADEPRALMYRAVVARANSMHRSVFRRRTRERRFAQSVMVEDPELRPDVVEAVIGLSPQQRACVYLMYWEDLSVRDVAKRLDLGEGTVKRYLARARARLREVLDD